VGDFRLHAVFIMTTVVNMRVIKGKPCPAYDQRVDRGTPFGNPYDHKRLGITRAESVALYKTYFLERVSRDAKFKEKVLTLKNLVLGCWCVPLTCHATVIAEYLNNYVPVSQETSIQS
jgi:hypothetical protein